MDERSTAGTFVGGVRVSQRLLTPGDLLRFADQEFVFEGDPVAPRGVAPTVIEGVSPTIVDVGAPPMAPAAWQLQPPRQVSPAAMAPRLGVVPWQPPAAPPRRRKHSGAGIVAAIMGVIALLVIAVTGAGIAGFHFLGPGFGSILPSRSVGSRKLAASDQPQTVRIGGQVSVTIPGGSFKGSKTLRVSTVTAPPPSKLGALRQGTVYDISLGDVREFEQPVTLELPYDTSMIAPETADKAVLAGAWVPEQKTWELVPVRLDKARGVAIVQTRHLCAWCLYYLARGYGVHQSANFVVVYDPNAGIPMGRQMQDSRDFAQRLGVYMEEARKRYVAAGFRVPAGKSFAFVETGRLNSERGGITGNLLFSSNYENVDEVRYEAAHEFFHAVQNEYFNVYSMGARGWWMEATASYAADWVWGENAQTRASFQPTYTVLPLSTMNDTHEYATGLFLARLVAAGAPFRGMWDAVHQSRSGMVTATSYGAGALPAVVLNPLERNVYTATGTSLPVHYLDFVGYLHLDAASPLASRDPASLSARRSDMPLNVHRVDTSLSVGAGYTAKVWTVVPAAPRDAPRRISIEATSEVPGSAQVGVFVLPGNTRTPGVRRRGMLSVRGQHLGVQVAQGDAIYVVAINSSPTQGFDVKLRAEDAAVTVAITPERVQQGEAGRAYAFAARVEGVPDHVTSLRYEWDFADGERQQGTVRPQQGITNVNASHRWPQGSRVLSLRVSDADRVELGELGRGTAQVEILPDEAGPPPDSGPIAAVPDASPASGPGTWVLKSTVVTPQKQHQYPNERMTFSCTANSASGSESFDVRACKKGTSTTMSWNSPPAFARPGDSWSLVGSVAFDCADPNSDMFQCNTAALGSSTDSGCGNYYNGAGNSKSILVGKDEDWRKGIHKEDCGKTFPTTQPRTFPDPVKHLYCNSCTQGCKFVINVSATTPGGQCMVKSTYEWNGPL